MKPFDAYEKYIALRTHFDTNSKYDFFANNGKTRVNVDSFKKRSDSWMFTRLASIYTDKDYIDLILANILKIAPNKIYSHLLLRNDAKDTMLEYQRRIQSLTYTFKNDMDNLMENTNNPDDIFRITNGKNPIILQKFYTQEISKETFIILNNFLNFFPVFDRKLNDDFSWDYHKKSCLKYKPFIQYDAEKLENIIKEKVNA